MQTIVSSLGREGVRDCGMRKMSRIRQAATGEEICLLLGMAEVDDEIVYHAILGKEACDTDSLRVQNVSAAFQAVGEALMSGGERGSHPVSPLCEAAPEANDASGFRRLLVDAMNLALEAWKQYTGKTKLDLADDSGIWNVYIDKSTPMTRTLDKYLSMERLPKRPRWRKVLQTIEFVLQHIPRESAEYERLVRMKLEIVQRSP